LPISLLADRLNDTCKDRSEEIGSFMWLGLGFTFHPTVFFILVTYPTVTCVVAN